MTIEQAIATARVACIRNAHHHVMRAGISCGKTCANLFEAWRFMEAATILDRERDVIIAAVEEYGP